MDDQIIINNFLDEIKKSSENYAALMESHLNKFFSFINKPILDISYKDVHDFLKEKIDQLDIKLKSKETYRHNINRFLKYCRNYYAINEGLDFHTIAPDKTIFKFTPKKKDFSSQRLVKKKILSKKQIETILDYILNIREYDKDLENNRLRDFCLFALCIVTGARISEIRTININDINLEERYFETGFVNEARKSSLDNQESLLFFFCKPIVIYLEEYINRISGKEWLFPGLKGYLSFGQANYIYKSIRKELEFKFSWNYFRETIDNERANMEIRQWQADGLMNRSSSYQSGKNFSNLELKKKREIYDKYYPYNDLKYIGIKKYKLFFSYDSQDSNYFKIKEIVDYIELNNQDFKIKYFERDKETGKSVIRYMEDGIEWCNFFIWFHSKNSEKSEAVNKEYDLAEMLNKNIITITENIDSLRPMAKAKWVLTYNHNIENISKLIIQRIKNK